MFPGTFKPWTPEELDPPHAVKKLRETIMSNFFIKISDCVYYYSVQTIVNIKIVDYLWAGIIL